MNIPEFAASIGDKIVVEPSVSNHGPFVAQFQSSYFSVGDYVKGIRGYGATGPGEEALHTLVKIVSGFPVYYDTKDGEQTVRAPSDLSAGEGENVDTKYGNLINSLADALDAIGEQLEAEVESPEDREQVKKAIEKRLGKKLGF